MVHRLVAATAACVGVLLLVGHAAAQATRPAPAAPQATLTLDHDALAGDSAILGRFPLPGGQPVDLVLHRFGVFGPEAQVVVADKAGERPADFDPTSVTFWRGTVSGYPGSHVFLSVAEGSTIGRIELGAGRPTYAITSSWGDPAAGGVRLEPGQVVVYRAVGAFWPEGPAAFCGVDGMRFDPAALPGPGHDGPGAVLTPPFQGVARGLRMARIAVDADYRFATLFDTERDAMVYLAQLYGIVSDLLVRDVGVRLDMVFLRVWTTPDDPYPGPSTPRDLPPGLEYDLGQMVSGHRDASAGGMASICGRDSWAAYMIGQFGDPTRPTVFNWDIFVTAHELGHNIGAQHTHPVDGCTSPATSRRGTIMSYCHAHNSGGPAAIDLHYHTFNRDRMRSCADSRFVADCNQNHVDDMLDIATGRSQDADGNGIPDECEDCNANGVLDGIDIASGTSLDLNENGVPDECEPDCNANGLPDDIDIRDGTSQDANGDALPDECQADCDGDGAFDWSQIIADMALDLDRDAVLDQCQDCDGDGVTDLDAMDHANEFWIISAGDGLLKNYTQQAGVLRGVAGEGLLSEPTDLRITADRRMLVASAGDGRIVEFDHRGAYVRDLVGPSAGLLHPIAMVLDAHGTVLVADRDAAAIRRFDLQTGAVLPDAVAPGAGGLSVPVGLAMGPAGNVFVAEREGGVLEFDGATGALVREFVAAGTGGLVDPRGMLFFPGLDGQARFVVADFGGDRLLEFDASTGESIGQFHTGSYGGKLQRPWALRFGPDGHVHASNSRIDRPWPGSESRRHMFAYYVRQGAMVFATVRGHDSTLENPIGFDFVPGHTHDCNLNRIPDACDIEGGRSADRNANGVPDECESVCIADCDGSGTVDLIDFLCFQNAFTAGDPKADCTADGVIDLFDFLCFGAAFDAGCR